MDLSQQSNFEGFAIVELMGHNKVIGYVTTEYFGGVALFRVDSPEIKEHDEVMSSNGYAYTEDGTIALPAGSVVKHSLIPARSVFVSPASLYALNPCTEEVACEAIKRKYENRPVLVLSMPKLKLSEQSGYQDADD